MAVDEKLRKGLKDAEKRDMFFGLIPTKGADGELIVCRSKSERDKKLKARREELKKQRKINGGKEIMGTCTGPIDKLVFEVSKKTGNLGTALRNAAKPSGLKVKPEVKLTKEADLERKEAELEAKAMAAEDEEEADEVQASDMVPAPPPATPIGIENADEDEDTPNPAPPPPVPSGNGKDVIMGLQKALKKVGYDPGPIDGIMGKKTSEALKQFQRDNGLAADGVAGPATQAAMAKALQAANKGDGGKGGGDPTSQTGTATLEVHVHDEQGKPVDGAKVRLSNGPTQKPDTPTNAGIARFEGLADGEYRVNAAKLNVVWEAAQVRQGKLAPGQTYVVTLNKLTKPGAAVGDLFVVVVRDDGKGEIDASVTAKPASGGQSVPGILTLGKYRFTLPAGEYRVTAFGRDGQTASISAQVDANKKNSAKIVLSSQPLGDMIVRVTLGGKSFEGADVRATPKGGGKYFGGKTDPDGKIVFLGTPAGEYTVFAADLGSGKSKTVSAQVQADETTGVDLALR